MKYLACLFVLFLLCLPVMGQDATAEATLESTPNAPVQIVAEDGATVTVGATDNVDSESTSPLAVLLGIITAYIGGVISTLAGVAVFVRNIMANPLWMALAEKFGGAIVPKEAGASAKSSLSTIGDFVAEVSDGVPAADKPKVATITYADGTVYTLSTGVFVHPDGSKSKDFLYRKPISPDTSTVSTHTLVSPATQAPTDG